MAQVLSSAGVKPQPWRVRPGRVEGDFQWAYDAVGFFYPLWHSGSRTFRGVSSFQRKCDLEDNVGWTNTGRYPPELSFTTATALMRAVVTGYKGPTGSQNRTVMMVGKIEGNLKTSLWDWGDSGNAATRAWRFVVDTDNVLRTEVSAGFYKAGSGFHGDGEYHVVHQVLRGTQTDDVEHWVDGVEQAQSDLNSNSVDTLADVDVGFGDNVTVSSNEYGGNLALWALWDRALTPDEIIRSAAQFFGPFRMARRTMVVVPAGTFAPPFVSAAAKRPRTLLRM